MHSYQLKDHFKRLQNISNENISNENTVHLLLRLHVSLTKLDIEVTSPTSLPQGMILAFNF